MAVFRTYPSLKAMYAAYTARVSSLTRAKEARALPEGDAAPGGETLPATGGQVLTLLGATLLFAGLGARRVLRRGT